MVRAGIFNRPSPMRLKAGFFCIMLCITIVFIAGACSTNRRVIKNEALDDWDGKRMRYKNLFPPEYGYLEESEYDDIDFRKSHEKGVKEYPLLCPPWPGKRVPDCCDTNGPCH